MAVCKFRGLGQFRDRLDLTTKLSENLDREIKQASGHVGVVGL